MKMLRIILSGSLVTAFLLLSPISFFADTQGVFHTVVSFQPVYAGGGSSSNDGTEYGGPLGANDFGPKGTPGPGGPNDSSFGASFGVMDAVTAVLGLALGPVVGVVGVAVSMGLNSLGVSNPGVSVGYYGAGVGLGAAFSNNVGINGPTAYALGAVAGAAKDAAGYIGSTVGSYTGGTGTNSSGSTGSENGGDGGSPGVLSQQVTVDSQAQDAGLSCADANYPQLCGLTSCIPADAVCCAAVGHADRYCPVNSFCRTDGQCEATSGGQNCSANYNASCQSSANSCGMVNSGFNSCSGSCQAVTPADASCPTPGITLTQTPAFVNPGEVCQVSWQTTNTTFCTLTNLTAGTNVGSGLSGNYSATIQAQTDFKLHCQNGTVVSSDASVSCRINPGFQEN